jgi:hypothetical protein
MKGAPKAPVSPAPAQGGGCSTRPRAGALSVDTQESKPARLTHVASSTTKVRKRVLFICVLIARCTPGSCSPGVLLFRPLRKGGSRSVRIYTTTDDTTALVSTGDPGVRSAFGISNGIFRFTSPLALRIRHAGPATPVNTGEVVAPLVAITSLSVLLVPGPDRGAATSVAKAIAALTIACATARRHVLGPGSRRVILCDSLVDRRALEPRRRLTRAGGR